MHIIIMYIVLCIHYISIGSLIQYTKNKSIFNNIVNYFYIFIKLNWVFYTIELELYSYYLYKKVNRKIKNRLNKMYLK